MCVVRFCHFGGSKCQKVRQSKVLERSEFLQLLVIFRNTTCWCRCRCRQRGRWQLTHVLLEVCFGHSLAKMFPKFYWICTETKLRRQSSHAQHVQDNTECASSLSLDTYMRSNHYYQKFSFHQQPNFFFSSLFTSMLHFFLFAKFSKKGNSAFLTVWYFVLTNSFILLFFTKKLRWEKLNAFNFKEISSIIEYNHKKSYLLVI